MRWRTSLVWCVLGPMVVAAACSDAALLEPKDDDWDPEGSGAVTGTGGGTVPGGKASTGGRKPSTGGKMGAGGSPWGAGGAPATGGYWNTGGFGNTAGYWNTGGATDCVVEQPIVEQCSLTPGLCSPLHALAAPCSEAARAGNLKSVLVGCGFAHLEISGPGITYSATYAISTGNLVEIRTKPWDDSCWYHSGKTPDCNAWYSASCNELFGDGGLAPPPPPPPTDAGLP